MQSIPLKRTRTQIQVNEFIRSVYNWMAIGLGITGFVAYFVSNSETMMRLIFGNQIIFFGLIIGELALVFSISARVQKMQASIPYLYKIFHHINIFYLCRHFYRIQYLRYGNKTGSNRNGSVHVYGTHRYCHCIGCQPIFTQFGNEPDCQLYPVISV